MNNTDKDNFSIDSILSDIARMKSERGDTQKEPEIIRDGSVDDALSEIDRLFNDDVTSLEGFSDYSEQLPDPIPSPQEAPEIETGKYGQDIFGAFTSPAPSNDFDFEEPFSEFDFFKDVSLDDSVTFDFDEFEADNISK